MSDPLAGIEITDAEDLAPPADFADWVKTKIAEGDDNDGDDAA